MSGSKKITNLNVVKKIKELSFFNTNLNTFPSLKLFKYINNGKLNYNKLIELNASNEVAVDSFLRNKIKFLDIPSKIWHFINLPLFSKFKRQKPKNLAQIEKLNEFVRLKTRSLSVISQKK